MKDSEQHKHEESVQTLEENDLTKVAGGMPKPPSSCYLCKKCGTAFSDAGTYFEHMAMVHGK